jgi:RNA polymerase sigma-70 factor (ECF subfamily)
MAGYAGVGVGGAADLAHDTFVRLLTGRTERCFTHPAEARAYLKTTAQNLCINLWRRQEIERPGWKSGNKP